MSLPKEVDRFLALTSAEEGAKAFTKGFYRGKSRIPHAVEVAIRDNDFHSWLRKLPADIRRTIVKSEDIDVVRLAIFFYKNR